MNKAVAGDEAVAVNDLFIHAEIAAAMAYEFVELFECAFVEQKIDALARAQFAFVVLLLPALVAATRFRLCMPLTQLIELVHIALLM